MAITGESTCVYAGAKLPCTWSGYSFDYQLPEGKSKVTLQCSARMSEPSNFGNPTAELQQNVDESPYELELSDSEGSFFNPQYSTLPVPLRQPGKVVLYQQACSYLGAELFEIQLELKFPER